MDSYLSPPISLSYPHQCALIGYKLSPSLTKRARRDLNPRPTEPESVALSTEPRALILARV